MNDEIEYLRKVYQSEETSTWINKLQMKSIVDYADKLQSNWNSLREWLESDNQVYFCNQTRQNGKAFETGFKFGLAVALDKMNELESGEKN